MKRSTYETWLEEERIAQKWIADRAPGILDRRLEYQRQQHKKRQGVSETFPYTTVLVGIYSEHDYAIRWCWLNISPPTGICDNYQSEYPACPLVLVTAFVEHGTIKDKLGQETPTQWVVYKDPGEHEHEGVWCWIWLGKTDYDYGFCEFYFANEVDREQFLAACSTFTWRKEWDNIDGIAAN